MGLLELRQVTRRFGGIVALDEVSLDVAAGEIAGLIGPNGAGKTTAFNVITRLYTPNGGTVAYRGEDLLKVAPHRIVGLGIARTFQNVELCKHMTVLDNVLVGAHARGRRRLDGAGPGAMRRFGRRIADTTFGRDDGLRTDATEILEYLRLGPYAGRPAAGLPFGTLKRIELARALAAKPALLLLDEPAGGLNHEEVSELGELIRSLRRDFRLTVLLVEHHMNLVMSVSDRVTVLNFGRTIAAGTPREIQSDPAVIEAYLGAGARHDDGTARAD